MNNAFPNPKIGLALSGGGIRAAVFHLGLLRNLAEKGRLEEVTQISTVSGGSLIIGAIFAQSAGKWPSSEQFLSETLPDLRALLTSKDLFSLKALGFAGFVRQNIKILYRRSEILSGLLSTRWGVIQNLSDLPSTPEWHINATCFETGKNWRFSKSMMGDWRFGRHFNPDIPIAKAIAASASVPYAIGAMHLDIPEHGWWSTDPASKEPLQKIVPPLRSVRLWDGGAYENLGLEPIYKPIEGLIGCDFLICSDASGPLIPPKRLPILDMIRGRLSSPRLFDIASDQIRALRSRMLMGSIIRGEVNGIIVRIGTSARQFGFSCDQQSAYLTDEQSSHCLRYPTNLTRIPVEDFNLIERHGYEIAKATTSTYAKTGNT